MATLQCAKGKGKLRPSNITKVTDFEMNCKNNNKKLLLLKTDGKEPLHIQKFKGKVINMATLSVAR